LLPDRPSFEVSISGTSSVEPPFYGRQVAIPISKTATLLAVLTENPRISGQRFAFTVLLMLNLQFAAGFAHLA
jgi:hypothetical protein